MDCVELFVASQLVLPCEHQSKRAKLLRQSLLVADIQLQTTVISTVNHAVELLSHAADMRQGVRPRGIGLLAEVPSQLDQAACVVNRWIVGCNSLSQDLMSFFD
jgi:hypothetical protein